MILGGACAMATNIEQNKALVRRFFAAIEAGDLHAGGDV
jgi:ketosteroid isomerase-like protein